MAWYDKRYYGKNLEKYEGKIVGEINPRNVMRGNFEKNILNTFGADIKIVYMLRNPVNGIFSYYKHVIEVGGMWGEIEKNIWTDGIFDEFVNTYLNNRNRDAWKEREHFSIFLYGRHLATALKYIPRENVHVIIFEDFIKNTQVETKKLLEFLGADPKVEIDYNVKENVGLRIPKSVSAIKKAKKQMALWHGFYVPHFPYMGSWIERKMDAWYWSIVDKASLHTDNGVSMSEETQEKLKAFYCPDVQLLDKVLGTDYLGKWGF